MQHDLSQRNQTTESTVGVRVGNDREMGGGGEHNLKKGGVRIQQGLHKIEGLTFLCQLCKETFPFKKTILFQDFPYIYILDKHIFLYIHLLMAISTKQTRPQPNIKLMLQKNLLKMLIIRYCFDSVKCFLIIVTCDVSHLLQDIRMTSIDVVLVSSLLTLGIFNIQFQCFCCQLSIITVSYDTRSPSLPF